MLQSFREQTKGWICHPTSRSPLGAGAVVTRKCGGQHQGFCGDSSFLGNVFTGFPPPNFSSRTETCLSFQHHTPSYCLLSRPISYLGCNFEYFDHFCKYPLFVLGVGFLYLCKLKPILFPQHSYVISLPLAHWGVDPTCLISVAK